MTDFHSLCIRLIIATDADNAKAQDYIISQIRLALHKEYGGFMNETEKQELATQDARIAPY
jgi:predicted cupin superfamily sugar epimerase